MPASHKQTECEALRDPEPADVPVEQPTRFEPVFNMETAKAQPLMFPQPTLIRADQVIQ